MSDTLVAERPGNGSTVEFDIYHDARVNADVQGSYARVLADAPPVFWTNANGGHWIITGYDEICQAVKEPALFSCREAQIPRIPNPPQFIPLSLDPPHNLPYRQMLMPAFSPRAVKEMEPKIRSWAKRIIAEVADNGQCDFARDIASLFPVSIFMELMGMPLDRLREFRSLADNFFKSQAPEEYEAAGAKIIAVLEDLIESRKGNLGSDLVSYFLTVEMEGRKLTHDEILRTSYLLFLGGMDTVTNVTGFAWRYLAGNPDIQARLANDFSLIPGFVEEALRMFAVVSVPRIVTHDATRFGVDFKEGQMVICVLSQGGRDPRVENDPNTMILDRDSKHGLGFSSGPHLCLGHALARAEMRILTEEWFKRIPEFVVEPGSSQKFRLGMVNSMDSLQLQWWETLPADD